MPEHGTRPGIRNEPGQLSSLGVFPNTVGANPQRHRDGALRAGRPLPEGYSPRAIGEVKMVLSPRWQRAPVCYEWGEPTVDYRSSNDAHFEMSANHRVGRSPRRHEHTGSYSRSEAKELICGLPSAERRLLTGEPRKLGPPPPTLRGASPRAAAPEVAPPEDYPRLSARQTAWLRMRELERTIHDERRATDVMKADFESQLRFMAIDPRSFHHPSGAPVRGA